MREDFLHYIWQYKLFSFKSLLGTKNEKITIVKSGVLNTNTGPDFLNAHIIIDEQKWVGNIEIHINASDWYAHNHEEDVNYDAVILHVVYEDDVTIFMKNDKILPTLVLKDRISEKLLNNYNNLFYKNSNWIPCGKDISRVDSFVLNNWLERLYLERLEEKSKLIKELLIEKENDYEAVLFILLVKNFGLKINGEAFFNLAQSVDFSIVRKESFNMDKLSALLFGQAGFLTEIIENSYHKKLTKEYHYLKHKYKLKPLTKNQFQFFRMRPHNFPTIRLAQLMGLYFKHKNLFSKLMNAESVTDFNLLLTVEVDDFWKTHYTFEKESKKSTKKITKSFIYLLIINTIIPLRFVYNNQKRVEKRYDFFSFLKELPLEKNSIITNFLSYKLPIKNALESQALLQLKNNYCDEKKCLKCSIGSSLLKL